MANNCALRAETGRRIQTTHAPSLLLTSCCLRSSPLSTLRLSRPKNLHMAVLFRLTPARATSTIRLLSTYTHGRHPMNPSITWSLKPTIRKEQCAVLSSLLIPFPLTKLSLTSSRGTQFLLLLLTILVRRPLR